MKVARGYAKPEVDLSSVSRDADPSLKVRRQIQRVVKRAPSVSRDADPSLKADDEN